MTTGEDKSMNVWIGGYGHSEGDGEITAKPHIPSASEAVTRLRFVGYADEDCIARRSARSAKCRVLLDLG